MEPQDPCSHIAGSGRSANPGTTVGDVLGTQRWARLLPIAFVTYSLAYLDRSNYSIAVAGGMKEDLAITGGVAAPYGPYFASISEFLPRQIAAPAFAVVNSSGAIGSYLAGWLDSATGSTSASFLMMASALAVAALIMLWVRAAPAPVGRLGTFRRNLTAFNCPDWCPYLAFGDGEVKGVPVGPVNRRGLLDRHPATVPKDAADHEPWRTGGLA